MNSRKHCMSGGLMSKNLANQNIIGRTWWSNHPPGDNRLNGSQPSSSFSSGYCPSTQVSRSRRISFDDLTRYLTQACIGRVRCYMQVKELLQQRLRFLPRLHYTRAELNDFPMRNIHWGNI